MNNRAILLLALAGCAPHAIAQAQAQTAPDATEAAAAPAADTGGDIVVTAQRRQERLQDVPISLTAVSGEALAQAGVDDVSTLQRLAPSLSVAPAGQAANSRIAIRGIGSSGGAAIEPSVAAFVDGIYIARAGALLGTMFDVDRVEVLNGPQGTLFGRNATVGAISIVTAEPQFTNSAEGSVEYGSFGRWRVQPTVNLAASDTLAFRLSGLYDRRDGYIHNDLTGGKVGDSEYRGVRLSARYERAPFKWELRADYQRTTGDGQTDTTVVSDSVSASAAANFTATTRGHTPILDDTYSQHISQVAAGSLDDRNWGLASDMSLDLGDGFTLRSLTGYRNWDTRQYEQDLVGTGLNLFGRYSPRQSETVSQEVQLLSPSDRPLSYVAGLYYLHETYDSQLRMDEGSDFCTSLVSNAAQRAVCLAGVYPTVGAATGSFDQKTDSYAAYGQATLKLTDTLAITGGGRYTRDEKSISIDYRTVNPFFASIVTTDSDDLSLGEGRFTYRISGTYKPSRDVLIFANYSTGYKSGGFDVSSAASPTANRTFAPERSDNWELGLKSQWLDHRVTFNMTLFRLTVDDFQLRSFDASAAAFNVRNAGSVRQQGVDFDVSVRPAEGLTLGTVLTLLDSKYTSFTGAPNLPGLSGAQDLTGQRATFSPKYSGTASADYRHAVGSALEATIATQLSFTGKANIGLEGDNNPQAVEPGYALWGAQIGLGRRDRGWRVYLQGENLTDKGYCTSRFAQTLGSAFGVVSGGSSVMRCVVGMPRTLRVGVSGAF